MDKLLLRFSQKIGLSGEDKVEISELVPDQFPQTLKLKGTSLKFHHDPQTYRMTMFSTELQIFMYTRVEQIIKEGGFVAG